MSTTPSSSPPRSRRHDALSGLIVFLIALPLSLGVASASKFPPIAGILTAIVGGIIASFIGSAPLTVKGPAAGLIVIALGSVMELGGGDLTLGYRRTLAVGVVAAVVQIVLALVRAGKLAIVVPSAIVHGMLAAIGVIIVTKQLPVMLGTKAVGKPLEGLVHIPEYIAQTNPVILLLGIITMAVLLIMPRLPSAKLRAIPASVIALILTVPLGYVFQLSVAHTYTFMQQSYQVGPSLLVELPASLLDAITHPDFSAITSATSIKYIIMFALVGSIESLLSVLAVDSMDPAHRSSDLNKDLLATGVGNLVCSCIGGLPMISAIVRSKANVDAGATSVWSNFYHGVYLLAFVALLPGLLQMIPLSVLAAMLVLTGCRLASPSEFTHALHIGKDQFAVFLTTLLVTLATDLLVGVGVGFLLTLVIYIRQGATLRQLFRTPYEVVREGDRVRVTLHGPVMFTNFFMWFTQLKHEVSEDIRRVDIDLAGVTLMDVTTQEKLRTLSNEWTHAELAFIHDTHLEHSTSHEHSVMTRRA